MGFPAGGTYQLVASFQPPTLKRERMGPPLARDPEIGAGPPPLRTVGGDPPSSGPMLREEVGQFMAERPFDLVTGNLPEHRIEPDFVATGQRHSGSRPHAPVPSDDDRGGQSGRQRSQKFGGSGLEFRIPIPAR